VIIIDENIDQIILDEIRSLKYEVYSIRDHKAGISDQEVIEITKHYRLKIGKLKIGRVKHTPKIVNLQFVICNLQSFITDG
jgi:hypothetical protein